MIDLILSPESRVEMLKHFEKLDRYGQCSDLIFYHPGMPRPQYVYDKPSPHFIRRTTFENTHQIHRHSLDVLSSMIYAEEWLSLETSDGLPKIITQHYISLQRVWIRWCLQTLSDDYHIRLRIHGEHISMHLISSACIQNHPEMFFQISFI